MSVTAREKTSLDGATDNLAAPKKLVGAARRNFIEPDKTPKDALVWRTNDPEARRRIMGKWRGALFFLITTETRPLKLAWALCDLMGKHGYAFARAAYLAEETQLTERNVRAALTRLEKIGAIATYWVKGDGKQERRTYPMASVIRNAEAKGLFQSKKRRPALGPSLGSADTSTAAQKRRPNRNPKGRPDAGPTEYKEPKEGALPSDLFAESLLSSGRVGRSA